MGGAAFLAPERARDKGALRDIMDVGSAVLNDPLKAIDSRRKGQQESHRHAAAA